MYKTRLTQKLKEALKAVIPIMALVIALSFTVAPMSGGVLLAFLFGGGLLTVGMMLFTLGAELAMAPMGERIGAKVTRTRKLWLVLALGFLLGFMITISEPDLQVLAQQVPGVPDMALSLIFTPRAADSSAFLAPDVSYSDELARLFLRETPTYMLEMGKALLPIVLFFTLFQIFGLPPTVPQTGSHLTPFCQRFPVVLGALHPTR